MGADAWANIVALVGIVVSALLFWVSFAKAGKDYSARLADLVSVRKALGSDASRRVKDQLDESMRILTARVAFREYGKVKGKKIANNSLRERFFVPIAVLVLFYGVSAMGMMVSSIWNPQLWGHDLKFWSEVAFFVALFMLLVATLLAALHQNSILRKFETALRQGTEEEFLRSYSSEAQE